MSFLFSQLAPPARAWDERGLQAGIESEDRWWLKGQKRDISSAIMLSSYVCIMSYWFQTILIRIIDSTHVIYQSQVSPEAA